MLRIYNTLTRAKQALEPIEPGHIRLYVCGMTVYDYCHLGHARVMTVFDMVARYLRSRFQVTYVRNITDIDDKIIARAAERGEPVEALTGRYIAAMHDDERLLGIDPPDEEPRATAHIPAIISMIDTLVRKGYAYRTETGDVYYRVRTFEHYGRLSGKSIDDLRSGVRVVPGEGKEDPLDFALWKTAKPGEPSWGSPWGPGRPGWHIECSAMSTECLGPHFDIHGGGPDLQFPHHENEIAQSEAVTGQPFVNIWMHNGPVDLDHQKMSKSLGNVLTIKDALAQHDAEALRYFLLSSHYRSPLDYSRDNLTQAKAALTRLYTALEVAPAMEGMAGIVDEQRFLDAMDDDFNTPVAISVLFDLAREIHRGGPEAKDTPILVGRLRRMGGLLGLLQRSPGAFLRAVSVELPEAEILRLIGERSRARADRRWEDSDRIREELKGRGVVLEDVPGGITRWRRQ